jgi:hypothetical protein
MYQKATLWPPFSEKSKHNMKLRVVKDDKTLTYDLNNTGEFEGFPP